MNYGHCRISGNHIRLYLGPYRFRFVHRKMLRRFAAVFRSQWFRCAMAALALNYAAEFVARNEPYWETDVAYLHWSTDVPAVTVCPAASGHPENYFRPPTQRLVCFLQTRNLSSLGVIVRILNNERWWATKFLY